MRSTSWRARSSSRSARSSTTVTGPPGTLAAAPPNVVHTFRNASDATAIFLNLHVPSLGFGDYMRGRNPAFDQHEPPPDGGRPLADAVLSGPGEARALEHDDEHAQ